MTKITPSHQCFNRCGFADCSPAVAQRPVQDRRLQLADDTGSNPSQLSAQATVPLPMSKMAVIYTDLLSDQKTGIAKFNSVLPN